MALALSEVGLAEETALLADVDPVQVRYIEETFLEESGSPVRNHAVTLHLTEADSTHLLPTLDWLLRQHVDHALRSGLTLVRHHVAKSLVVNESEVDVDLHHLALNA